MNKNYGWCSDIHLDKLRRPEQFALFFDKINDPKYNDGIFITGDIALGNMIVEFLHAFEKAAANKKIWFVLGNHDYYNTSFKAMSNKLKKFDGQNSNCCYLTNKKQSVQLNDFTCLVGVDGWYDGKYAPFENSKLLMKDDIDLIKEFKSLSTMNDFYSSCKQYSVEFAKKLELQLQDAIEKNYKTVIVLTHVPPFKENSVYDGKQSDKDWLPFFSSKEIGDVLLKFAKNNPFVNFRVFCGHSHGTAYYSPIMNLECKTSYAKYGYPTITETITIE